MQRCTQRSSRGHDGSERSAPDDAAHREQRHGNRALQERVVRAASVPVDAPHTAWSGLSSCRTVVSAQRTQPHRTAAGVATSTATTRTATPHRTEDCERRHVPQRPRSSAHPARAARCTPCCATAPRRLTRQGGATTRCCGTALLWTAQDPAAVAARCMRTHTLTHIHTRAHTSVRHGQSTSAHTAWADDAPRAQGSHR